MSIQVKPNSARRRWTGEKVMLTLYFQSEISCCNSLFACFAMVLHINITVTNSAWNRCKSIRNAIVLSNCVGSMDNWRPLYNAQANKHYRPGGQSHRNNLSERCGSVWVSATEYILFSKQRIFLSSSIILVSIPWVLSDSRLEKFRKK